VSAVTITSEAAVRRVTIDFERLADQKRIVDPASPVTDDMVARWVRSGGGQVVIDVWAHRHDAAIAAIHEALSS
jgi:hypothetical protein